ncbi:Dynamin family protein [Succinivibrio dextrinosolvens]|uniref:dynamin family protein n=1 Tax=Succinivibrio dextrinosolvens TaxID=83771 RepID=UPI0008E8316C|nr:dynamin family protein [Succinivibrio dextrinosolvens]SFS76779.1 Dynamin family protein [Succinivibrio dextrinosolvens]
MNKLILKDKYIEILDNADSIIDELCYSDSFSERSFRLHEEIKNQELIIPLIGNFSAGKSSLVNAILNTDILPVAIKPETSLATELRYGQFSSLTAIDKNNNSSSVDISRIKELTESASDYKYLKLSINNEYLKDIEPLVLVDMPGFNSPLDHHNQAILNYLDKGCYYIALSPSTDGTLDKRLLVRLRELAVTNRKFSLFISKSDLKDPKSIKEIQEHIKGQLEEEFDYNSAINAINVRDTSVVKSAIESIDPNMLFSDLYKDLLLIYLNDVKDKILTEKNSIDRNSDELSKVIKEINESISKFQDSQESEIKRMRQTYGCTNVNDIIDSVGRELSNSKDEIISVLISGNRDEASSRLNEIVRANLLESVNAKLYKISTSINSDFSQSLASIDATLKKMEIDEHFAEKIVEKIQKTLTSIKDLTNSAATSKVLDLTSGILSNTARNTGFKASTALAAGAAASSGGTILGMSLSTVMPVIGIVIMFLPEILTPIIGAYQKNKIMQELEVKLDTEVFPSIKRKLRNELPVRINEHIIALIMQIREQFSEELNAKKEDVDKVIREKESNIAAIDGRKQILEQNLSQLEKLIAQL